MTTERAERRRQERARRRAEDTAARDRAAVERVMRLEGSIEDRVKALAAAMIERQRRDEGQPPNPRVVRTLAARMTYAHEWPVHEFPTGAQIRWLQTRARFVLAQLHAGGQAVDGRWVDLCLEHLPGVVKGGEAPIHG